MIASVDRVSDEQGDQHRQILDPGHLAIGQARDHERGLIDAGATIRARKVMASVFQLPIEQAFEFFYRHSATVLRLTAIQTRIA